MTCDAFYVALACLASIAWVFTLAWALDLRTALRRRP